MAHQSRCLNFTLIIFIMAFRLDQLLFLFGLSICWVVNSVKNSGHDILFFNLKFYNGMRDVPSDGLVSFCDITQKMFCNLAEISHPAKVQFYFFKLGLAIELCWWLCLLCNMLLKKHHKAFSASLWNFLGFSMPNL